MKGCQSDCVHIQVASLRFFLLGDREISRTRFQKVNRRMREESLNTVHSRAVRKTEKVKLKEKGEIDDHFKVLTVHHWRQTNTFSQCYDPY